MYEDEHLEAAYEDQHCHDDYPDYDREEFYDDEPDYDERDTLLEQQELEDFEGYSPFEDIFEGNW